MPSVLWEVMASSTYLPTCGAFLILLAACSPPRATEPTGRTALTRSFPLPTAWGGAGPLILSPRHRIFSPSPPVLVITPGWEGPLEIVLQREGRRSSRRTMRARQLSWPWPALAQGERFRLEVGAGGLRAVAEGVRVRRPSGPGRVRHLAEEARWWLRQGHPVAALERSSRARRPVESVARAAALACGLPAPGEWCHGRACVASGGGH